MFHQQDESWIETIDQYRKRVVNIKIPQSIEPSQGKHILSQLDDIYGSIRIMYGDIAKQLDEVDSLIERFRRKGEAQGSNTETRKANGIYAVENIELAGGSVINLYNIRTKLYSQKEDISAILSIIEKKQSMVITMSGLLKIESNIAGH